MIAISNERFYLTASDKHYFCLRSEPLRFTILDHPFFLKHALLKSIFFCLLFYSFGMTKNSPYRNLELFFLVSTIKRVYQIIFLSYCRLVFIRLKNIIYCVIVERIT